MDKGNKNNNNKEINVINELSSTEEDIIKLGEIITSFLTLLKNGLEGDTKCSNDCQKVLKEIFLLINKINKNMHELVDKVYSKKSFTYFSKLSKDLIEKEKELNKLFVYFNIEYFALPRQNQRQSMQSTSYEKPTPTFLSIKK